MKANVLQRKNMEGVQSQAQNRYKLAFMSLGCAKNLVDSERVLGDLLEYGLVLTDEMSEAHMIVINTCGFLESAEKESMDAIRKAVSFKTNGKGNCSHVMVIGCLAERREDEIKERVPEVDAVIGSKKREKVKWAARSLLSGANRSDLILTGGDEQCNKDVGRYRLTQKHFGYVKIGEGCNNVCTFCIIPQIRGKLKDKSLENIREETKELAADGTKEINVIGQDTTDYGTELYGERRLEDALETVADVPGIEWVRLMYAYPGHLKTEALKMIRDHPDIVPYIDIPVQHISKRILKRMARGTSQEEVYRTLDEIRNIIPEVAIRTTLIVGFPGETEEDFQELKSFVETYEFERLGVFEYSDEESAPAKELDQKVPDDVKKERWEEIMKTQREIAFDNAQNRVGETEEVLIEKESQTPDEWVGRTRLDAPEQDPVIYVKGNNNGIEEGDLINVEITGARGYDLEGQKIT